MTNKEITRTIKNLIEKQNRILDVVKKLFKEHLLEAIECDGGYLIMLYAEAEMPITKEQYETLKEWLEND